MSPVLLDTHALVWSLLTPDRLTPRARSTIEAAEVVLVSAVSIYEIDNKRRTRPRETGDPLWRMPADLHVSLPPFGVRLIPITPEAASLAANLPLPHRDPWDRLLLAQASLAGAALVTGDAALQAHAAGVQVVW